MPETLQEAIEPPPSGVGGVRMLDARLLRVDASGAFLEDLSDVLVGGQVELNIEREIKLTASLTLRQPERVRPWLDYLAPFITYQADASDEHTYPLGIFAVRVPPGTYGERQAVATFAGEDLTSVLATSAYTSPHTVASGTPVVSELTATIQGAGLTRIALPTATTRTFRKDWTFAPGTTRLEKCNRVLDHIGWYRLYMTTSGQIASPGRYVEPSRQQPFTVWTEDVLVAEPEEQPRDELPANVVIVVRDDPNDAPLVAVARNDDPRSPTSTVSVGREIVRVERTSDIHSQGDADAMAKRLLAEARLRYRTLRLRVLPDPHALEPWQTVDLAFSGLLARFNGRWRVQQASLGLTPENAALDVTLAQSLTEEGTPV